MARKIFVVGHKNPDTDSIAAAIAFSELLRLQGMVNVHPARQGEVWPETRFVLDQFCQPMPVLIDNVRPSARDVMRNQLLADMQTLRAEKGYAALLFMVVDIVHSQTEILIAGMETEVAEPLGQHLASPHSVIIGGIMSRKKQVVPILPGVARQHGVPR
jgi:inorganic pyrophosphatase/exopolyphosphatase